MDILTIVSSLLLIFSLILIFKPSAIFKLNRICSKVIFTDSEFFSSPKISGILFVVFGIIIVVLGVYIKDMIQIIKL